MARRRVCWKWQLAKQSLENKNQVVGTAGRGSSQRCVGRGQGSMMEHPRQGKRELEMAEKGSGCGSQLGPASWIWRRVLETLYRCPEVWFWLLCEGCLVRDGESGKEQARTL